MRGKAGVLFCRELWDLIFVPLKTHLRLDNKSILRFDFADIYITPAPYSSANRTEHCRVHTTRGLCLVFTLGLNYNYWNPSEYCVCVCARVCACVCVCVTQELTNLGKPKRPRSPFNIFMSEHFEEARGTTTQVITAARCKNLNGHIFSA